MKKLNKLVSVLMFGLVLAGASEKIISKSEASDIFPRQQTRKISKSELDSFVYFPSLGRGFSENEKYFEKIEEIFAPNMKTKFGGLIIEECKKTKLPEPITPFYLESLLIVESSGHTDASNPSGAKGLMQLLEETFERFCPEGNIFSPKDNIGAAISYLTNIHNNFMKSPEYRSFSLKQKQKALSASYNWGPGSYAFEKGRASQILEFALEGKGKVPKETRDHTKKITKYLEEYLI